MQKVSGRLILMPIRVKDLYDYTSTVTVYTEESPAKILSVGVTGIILEVKEQQSAVQYEKLKLFMPVLYNNVAFREEDTFLFIRKSHYRQCGRFLARHEDKYRIGLPTPKQKWESEYVGMQVDPTEPGIAFFKTLHVCNPSE